ncbi:DUF4348 domain-containing protein [Maribacter sp. 2-571]|uniref:DUF4348 domain-containing protein n=1 Tax=Maribacter sp. 2-571 TaxID=3417569 RepID=UPI003D33F7BD
MKQILILITFVFLFSCNNNNNVETTRLEKKIDSLKAELQKNKTPQPEVKIEEKVTQEYNNESFNSFFYSFMTDSVFQRNRIKFPLKYHTTDIETMKDTLIIIRKNEWKHNPFYFNTASERTQIYDNFEMKFQPSNERILHWYGIEAGGNSKYYFTGFDGKWFLTKEWDSGI